MLPGQQGLFSLAVKGGRIQANGSRRSQDPSSATKQVHHLQTVLVTGLLIAEAPSGSKDLILPLHVTSLPGHTQHHHVTSRLFCDCS